MSAEKCTDIGELQSAIEDMDCMATDAFGQISAIARLMLDAMENPTTGICMETFAKAITVICSKADEANDCVGNTAEQVGCGYVDAMSERRDEARRARELQAKGGAS